MIKLNNWLSVVIVALSGLTHTNLYAAERDAAQPNQSIESSDEQANSLLQKIKSGEMTRLKDAAVIELFSQASPSALAGYLNAVLKPLNGYEMWIKRQERIRGKFNDDAFLNHMKFSQDPRRIYVKWLDGGPYSGQEIIYDETKRKAEVYGHLGGFLNVTSIWMALDGIVVRANTNHNVRDELSLQFFAQMLGQRLAAMQSAGTRMPQVEVINVQGGRRVALTLPPTGQKSPLYGGKIRVALDLDQPMIRQFEAWDESGEIVERIIMERVQPATWTEVDFDPKNKSYKF